MSYTYEELLDSLLVDPLVRQCQQHEARIAELESSVSCLRTADGEILRPGNRYWWISSTGAVFDGVCRHVELWEPDQAAWVTLHDGYGSRPADQLYSTREAVAKAMEAKA